MLEVKIPGVRHGRGYVSTNVTKGTWVTPSGTFSSGDISGLPTGQKDAPGYASEGDIKLVPAGSVLSMRGKAFPVNKLIYAPDGADSSSETILAGAGAVYYEGGEYESDQYVSISGTGGAPGDALQINVNSKLVEATSSDPKDHVAVVEKIMYGPAGNAYDRLWFRILN